VTYHVREYELFPPEERGELIRCKYLILKIEKTWMPYRLDPSTNHTSHPIRYSKEYRENMDAASRRKEPYRSMPIDRLFPA
jgi:hypothetical protein